MQEILEQVKNKIKATEGRQFFAVFDFDNTCIINDIAEATLNYMAANGLFKASIPLPAATSDAARRGEEAFKHYYSLLAENRIKEAYAFNAEILSGLSVAEVEELVGRVVADEGSSIGKKELFGLSVSQGLAPRPAAIALINALHDLGVKIWIVSASPILLVRPAMKIFNVKGEIIGVRNKIENNLIASGLEYPLSILEGKVDCIKKFIDPAARPILGAGDSANDLPMLEYSDLKVVVDRGNALAERALAEGWFLI